MDSFEYAIIQLATGPNGFGWYGSNTAGKVGNGNDLHGVLNAYGAQGWALVSSHAHSADTGRTDVHTVILMRKRA